VVEDADAIKVTLADGREFKGVVKGADKRADLAVIKINAENLPVGSLGDSDKIKIGQWVVAVGNPFGFALHNPEPTVTVGVVSALHRFLAARVSKTGEYSDLIQTDAAINPGNSGGPLVNLKGEIIGINVAIFTTSGGYQGIGFAIPINAAKRILSRLIEGKKIEYGWLGVSVQDLTEDLAKNFGLDSRFGALVIDVMPDSPASKAEIKEGDVIRSFDGQTINSTQALLNLVGRTEVGRKVKMSIIRQNRQITLETQITQRPRAFPDSDSVEDQQERLIPGTWRGLSVEDITPENTRLFRLTQKTGVVVVNVENGSAADSAAIVPGDVISAVNRKEVKDTIEFNRIISGLKGDVLLKLSRGYFIIKEPAD
jgi:serine protease Do